MKKRLEAIGKKLGWKGRLVVRAFIYATVLLLAIQTAFWVSLSDDTKQFAVDEITMQTQALGFWEFEKSRVDHINKAAEDYITYYKLQPGHPLPPSTFFDEEDPTWRLLNKKEAMQILNSLDLKGERSSGKVMSLIAIGDKVPEAGSHYAHGAIIGNPKIIPTGFIIYPISKETMGVIQRASQEVERKSGKEGNTNLK